MVIGAIDPDPRVSGSGIERLRASGMTVEVTNDPEAREVDPAYFHHRETGMPMVTLKYAMTLDGSAAAADRTSQWITSEQARLDAHVLRSTVDAVLVGAGTLESDDPRLDVRTPGYEGHQPRPVVLTGKMDLPERARIWDREPLVISTIERSIPSGELLVVEGNDRPDPRAACLALADRGLLSLLLEGGARVTGAWWRAGVITNGVVYLGASIGGGAGIPPIEGLFQTIGDARSVRVSALRRIQDDIRIDYVMEH